MTKVEEASGLWCKGNVFDQNRHLNRRVDGVRIIFIYEKKTGESSLLELCEDCYDFWRMKRAEKIANREALTKAFGPLEGSKKAIVKIGSVKVKGMFRGANFYPYYHLVKKHKLKCVYYPDQIEVVEYYK